MNDLFAPPGNEWRAVSPQLGRMRHTVLLVLGGIALVGWLVAAGTLEVGGTRTVLVATAVLASLAAGWWGIGRNVRVWGYAERDVELYIKHGALFRELVAVPYGRMQFVDIKAGPLEQLYGIATVHLHTASTRTNARIPGLPAVEAARLRDRLTELGEAQAAGL